MFDLVVLYFVFILYFLKCRKTAHAKMFNYNFDFLHVYFY